MVKKIARLAVVAVFCIVALMPDAAPLVSGGTEFIMEAVFGAANIPPPSPITSSIIANSRYVKLNGRTARSMNAMPGNDHAPCRRGSLPRACLRASR